MKASSRVYCLFNTVVPVSATDRTLLFRYADNWFQVVDPSVNCTAEELQTALEGHLTAESLIKNLNNVTTLSGMVRTISDKLDENINL